MKDVLNESLYRSHYISDASSDEDNEFEIAAPGGKLDESRYNNYHRSLRSRRGIAPPSTLLYYLRYLCSSGPTRAHPLTSMFVPTVHTKGQTIVNEILRIFDLSYEYGPCVGVTRLARWERAYKAGLNPPIQVRRWREFHVSLVTEI
jgi:hypothetical protein